jgi:hypothetical protein
MLKMLKRRSSWGVKVVAVNQKMGNEEKRKAKVTKREKRR